MRERSTWGAGQPTTLDVAMYNERAVRFYTRHGFQPARATAVFEDAEPVMTMAAASL